MKTQYEPSLWISVHTSNTVAIAIMQRVLEHQNPSRLGVSQAVLVTFHEQLTAALDAKP